MIRQTGGTAVGEISTRSSPFCFAMASACGGGMMPSCSPVSSMTRISRTRIRSLTRVRSSRRGFLSKAITASCYLTCFAGNLTTRPGDERVDGARALIPAGARAYRDRAFGTLAIADDQHVGNLLQLGLTNLISNLFLPAVELRPQPRLPEPRQYGRAIGEVPIRNRDHDALNRRKPEREG